MGRAGIAGLSHSTVQRLSQHFIILSIKNGLDEVCVTCFGLGEWLGVLRLSMQLL